MARIVPVILSGGTGSRLWPLSRQSYPKQLLAFTGERTLLQEAVLRAADRKIFGAPIVIANVEHRFVIAEQLRAVGVDDARIVLEPVGRNTAPAVAVAAILAARDDPEAIILVMPSDHVIADQAGFISAIDVARGASETGALVLFGMRPTRPETGYGYIQPGDQIGEDSVVQLVASFVEKPHEATAIQYVAAGYLWNSGIFLLPVSGVLSSLTEHAPDILAAAEGAVAAARSDLDFIRLGEAEFRAAPSISIDRAVMERTDRAAVVPASFGWSDAGTWTGLWEIGTQDKSGNVQHGESVLIDTKNSYVRSEGPVVATIGVSDLVVVATDDAVLVTSKGASQRVSELVDLLKQDGARVATESIWVHRPWGYYRSVHSGDGFQVKRITVNPGRRMSLQRHRHRAEHWVVVSGTALVTRDDDEFTVARNESVFLPRGCVHRLENATDVPLDLIEVQSGDYLGEDDIERLEDDFARIEAGPNSNST